MSLDDLLSSVLFLAFVVTVTDAWRWAIVQLNEETGWSLNWKKILMFVIALSFVISVIRAVA